MRSYFTAKIIDSAAKGEDSVSSQAQYHNALTAHCGGRLSFVMGNSSLCKANQHIVPADDPKCWPRDCDKIQVWKLEEKQSDVYLALHLYDDALNGEVDQVVLVTNDTDLAPTLEMLKVRCPHIVRGLVIPTRKVGAGGDLEREANVSLAQLAHGSGGISRRMSCAPHNCHMSFLAAAAPASSHTHGMRNRITLRRCWKWRKATISAVVALSI
ncbi:hypothetical protein QO004_004182 [Rhizobium mesoamericanum]|uniref:NYN domain-containing protein n=1 Tax=Rhizobium mesoamericanum TaxID=1079800 RepID=UPI002789C947|nr:NYN domain-containing protein [Rhizobium mesoamericanum]MDQ0562377.1 hypothetical protein [Rhizobium mesoamericanum]